MKTNSSLLLLILLYTTAAQTQSITVVLDPGHGGSDGGSHGNYWLNDWNITSYEKEANLDVAVAADDLIDAYAQVTLTRSSDKDVSVTDRVDIAKHENADFFISIHHNAAMDTTVQYTATFYCRKTQATASQQLAQRIQNEILWVKGYLDKGVMEDYDAGRGFHFGVLEGLQGSSVKTAILGEASFISHPEEAQLLNENPWTCLSQEYWSCTDYNRWEGIAYYRGWLTYLYNDDPDDPPWDPWGNCESFGCVKLQYRTGSDGFQPYAEPGNQSVRLFWKPQSHPPYWIIQRSRDGTTWDEYATEPGWSTSFIDYEVTTGQPHYYFVTGDFDSSTTRSSAVSTIPYGPQDIPVRIEGPTCTITKQPATFMTIIPEDQIDASITWSISEDGANWNKIMSSGDTVTIVPQHDFSIKVVVVGNDWHTGSAEQTIIVDDDCQDESGCPMWMPCESDY